MTDSYVPTTNANGTTQNIASQQSERDGETIETQEFALTAEQLEALVPPSVATLATSAKQDTQTTALGSLLTELQGKADVTETQPVSGPLTDTQLRATPVPVSGSFEVTGALTDEELRATPVPVSGTFYQATQPVSGTVTAELSAVDNAVLDDIKTGIDSVLTDTELRATPVPVSGTVSINADQITAITPPANPDPSTETKQDDLITAIGALNDAVDLLAKLTDTQPVDAGYSKVSTLNSGSGVHVGGDAGSEPIWTGEWEDVSGYSSVLITGAIPDSSYWLFLAQYSYDGVTSIDVAQHQSSYLDVTNSVEFMVEARYCRIMLIAQIEDEGSGEHAYTVNTIFKKTGLRSFSYGADTDGAPTTFLFDPSSKRLRVDAAALSSAFEDGSITTIGTKADARSTATDTTAASLIAIAKNLSYMLQNPAVHPVSDNGGALTVDGTVTANLGDTDNAVLDAIAASVAGATPAGTNNIGTVAPYAQPANFVSGATASITDTTATQVIAAQGAGVINYVTQILVTNGDADTGTFVNITDGSGGTVLYTGFAAANGGGFTVNFPTPLKFTANTAVYCACVTTGATVRVCASGYKGA